MKIILWDIEATNLKADFGYMLSFGYKELGEKEAHVVSIADFPRFKTDPTNDKDVVRAAVRILESADMWVTWYGKRFDVPYVNSRMLLHGMKPLPPVPHVDGWFISKFKLKLHNNRLASASYFLGLEEKTPLNGPIWIRASAGHKPSIKYVNKHCKQDVIVLQQVYEKLRPLMTTHPNLTLISAGEAQCGTCGSASKLQKRGFYMALSRRYQRYHCQTCGGWSHGRTSI